MKWTEQQVSALAPNDSTERRGKMLGSSSKWLQLATNYEAIWGTCKGSGAQPYITQVNLKGPSYKCSCPVRKLPCKHILGLLFLFAKSSAAFKFQAPPPAIQTWLERQSGNSSSNTKSPTTSIVDAEKAEKAQQAKEKRWQQRLALMGSGLDELELWLADVVRQGLANSQLENLQTWNSIAAKMMDAKLPRVSTFLKETHLQLSLSNDWSELVLLRFGELFLWINAFRARTQLSPDLQEALYQLLGKNATKTQVVEASKGVQDSWLVLSQYEGVDVEGHHYRKVWLYGQEQQQYALLLDYVFGFGGYDQSYLTGSLIKGRLHYYAKLVQQRAVLPSFELETAASEVQPQEYTSLNELLEAYAKQLEVYPWLNNFPATLSKVSVFVNAQQQLLLYDQHQVPIELPILPEIVIWKLAAISGGQPISLFGEWNGLQFMPLSVPQATGVLALH